MKKKSKRLPSRSILNPNVLFRILAVLAVLGCCYAFFSMDKNISKDDRRGLLRRWTTTSEEEEDKFKLRIEHEINVKLEERISDIRNEQEQWRGRVERKIIRKDTRDDKSTPNEDFLSRATALVDTLSKKEKKLRTFAALEEDLQSQLSDLSDAMEDVTKMLYTPKEKVTNVDRMRQDILPLSDCTDALHPESVGSRDKLLVFGLGTGRSGTKGLATLLNRQHLATVTHEYKLGTPKSYLHIQPWNPRKGVSRYYVARQRINDILQNSSPYSMVLGDVWSVHLPYVEHYLCLAPNAKFVILERPREDVVRSFDEWTSREGFVDKHGEHYSYVLRKFFFA